MGCTPSGLIGAPGSYPFLIENRHQCAKLHGVFTKNFTKSEARRSFSMGSKASEEDGSLSLSHKGLENTTYERKGPDIRRAFFIKQREDIIDERLNNVGLQQLRLTDDGNCLFQSLSYQLYGFSYKHEEIRMKICALMGDSKETLLQYFDSMEQLEKYIDEMSKDARWGDELALHYAAEKFQVEIHVLTCEDKNFYRHYKPAFNKETKDVSHRHIFLSYVPPMHFQPICTEKSMRRLKSIVDVS